MEPMPEPAAPPLVCPVCRARQTQQLTCRRCEADLELYVLALRSLQVAEQQVAEAQAEPNHHTQRASAQRYLNWLRPQTTHDES